MNLETHPSAAAYTAALASPGMILDAGSAAEKLALALLNLAECTEIDVANSIFITKPLSNAELAGLSDTPEPLVARWIERFQRRNLISTRRQRLILLQPSALYKIAFRKKRHST